MDNMTSKLIAVIEAALAFEELPTTFARTRDGWAGYKGNRRITRFVFSEETARELATERDASDVKVQF